MMIPIPRQDDVVKGPHRFEKDLLGQLAVPAEAYYGVQTQRALENFILSGVPLAHFPKLIVGLAMVKRPPPLPTTILASWRVSSLMRFVWLVTASSMASFMISLLLT